MPSPKQKLSPEKDRSVLLIVALAALIVRLLFFSGINFPDDLANAERITGAANLLRSEPKNLLSALSDARISAGGFRNLVVFAPYFVSQWVFGVNLFSSLLLSVISSLANIFLVHEITKRFFSSTIARMAVLFWAFFPLDITLSTVTITAAPVAFLFLLSLWQFQEGIRKQQLLSYSIALGAGLLTFLIEPWLAICLSLVFAYLWCLEWKRTSWYWRTMAILAALLVLVWGMQLGDAFLQVYYLVLNQRENLLFLTLFFVAATVTVNRDPKVSHIPLVLAGLILVTLMAKIIGSGVTTNFDLSHIGSFLLILHLPFTMMFGNFFSKGLDETQTTKWVSPLAIIGMIAATLAVQGTTDLLPSYKNLDWIGLHSLFMIYSILTGLAFIGVLASPVFTTGRIRIWKQKLILSLILTIILSSLSFSWDRRNDYRYLAQAPAQAWEFVKRQEPLPIFTLNEEVYLSLSLWARSESSQNQSGEANLPQLTEVQEINRIRSGYFIGFENELPQLPPIWWRMGSFGPLGRPRIAVYRVLPANVAQITQQGDTANRYGTAINAGLFCEAYEIWQTGQSETVDSLLSIPINPEGNCFVRSENLVTLKDLQKRENIDGNITFRADIAVADPENILVMNQITIPVFDMRSTHVEVDLQPNTLYLYSVDIESLSPTATLYWSVNGKGDYLEMRSYPEWTTVAVLLLTPDWSGPQTVSFSPALFDHLDTISLRSLYIGAVDFERN